MGAIIGGVSGFILLLMGYIGTKSSTPPAAPIQEVRYQGIVGSTEKKTAPGMMFPNLGMTPLRREDYAVVGTAKGTGCAHYVGLWPLPVFWTQREHGSIKWFYFDSEAVATDAAWYEAIASLPQADALISSRTNTKEQNSFALWYRRDCVDLSGKGIEIKLDKKE